MDPLSAIFVMAVLSGLFVKGVDVATDGWLSAEVGAGVRGASGYAVRAERARWGRARAKAREIRQQTPQGQAVQEMLDLAGLFGRTLFGEMRRFGSGARSEWRTARDQARSARTERRGDAPWPIVRAARSGHVRAREWAERRARSSAAAPNDDPNEPEPNDPNEEPEPATFVPLVDPERERPSDWWDRTPTPNGDPDIWQDPPVAGTVCDAASGERLCERCGERPWTTRHYRDPWGGPFGGSIDAALGVPLHICGRCAREIAEPESDHLGPLPPKCPDCGMPLVISSLSDHRMGRDRCHYADMDDGPDEGPNEATRTRRFFHASPAALEPGQVLSPARDLPPGASPHASWYADGGDSVAWRTGRVWVWPTLAHAAKWAVSGERIYEVEAVDPQPLTECGHNRASRLLRRCDCYRYGQQWHAASATVVRLVSDGAASSHDARQDPPVTGAAPEPVGPFEAPGTDAYLPARPGHPAWQPIRVEIYRAYVERGQREVRAQVRRLDAGASYHAIKGHDARSWERGWTTFHDTGWLPSMAVVVGEVRATVLDDLGRARRPYRIEWFIDGELSAQPASQPVAGDPTTPNGDPNVPLPSTVPDASGAVKCGCCAHTHAPLPPGQHCTDCHIHDQPTPPNGTTPNAPTTRGTSMDVNSAPTAIAAAETFRGSFESLQSRADALAAEWDTLKNEADTLHGEFATLMDGMGDFAIGGEVDTAASVGELSDSTTSAKEQADNVVASISTAKEAVDAYIDNLHLEYDASIEAAAGKAADVHSVMQEA